MPVMAGNEVEVRREILTIAMATRGRVRPRDVGEEKGCTRDGIELECMERTVGVTQREGLYIRADGNFRGDAQEILAVLASVIGDAADGAFVIEQVVGERRYGAHVNAAQNERAALAQGAERHRNNFSRRGKDDSGVERSGRLGEGVAGPDRAQIKRQPPMTIIARGCVDRDVPVAGDLDGQVRRGAESVETKLSTRTNAGQAQATEADDAGAKQRSGLLVGECVGDGINEIFGGDDVFGVTAVHGVAREFRMIAQVFGAGSAVLAYAVGVMQPGDAHARARAEALCAAAESLDHADDLMAGDERGFPRWQLAFDDVQIGTAYAAAAHAHE